jgi:flagellar assembly protein FliH
MTSSSTEAPLEGTLPAPVEALRLPALDGSTRAGNWTRLGGASVLGDAATESVLSGLAERTRDAARAQGYAVGWSQGRRAGEEDARAAAEQEAQRRAAERARQDAEHAHAVAALQAAARRLDETGAAVRAAVESRAVEVALRLAEAVLMRELATAADPGADALRRALSLVPAGETVTVRLHPQDLAGLGEQLVTGQLGGHTVRLVDDPSLARGDAVAETDTAVVDATVSSALARVREVLAR